MTSRRPGRLMHSWLRSAIIAVLLVTVSACANRAAAPPTKMQPATVQQTFRFDDWAGPAIKVWMQAPARIEPDTPIVFVMHGVQRDADRYLAEWAPIAARDGFILVVPEFSQQNFPGSRSYNAGFLEAADGTPLPRSRWSFSVIEPIFDSVRERTGSRVPAYTLYGHSAGAQFVHRYVALVPDARLRVAIAANAGWYTMPDLQKAFPYGWAGTAVNEATLKQALGKPLIILLGTADTDVAHPNLRRTPEANAQGPHRYARGRSFHHAGQAARSASATSPSATTR